MCYFGAATDATSCLSGAFCSDAQLNPISTQCAPYCALPTLGQAECDCSLYIGDRDSPFFHICQNTGAMLWATSASGDSACVSYGLVNVTTCAALQGGYFWGAQWVPESAYPNETSCTVGGSCSDGFSVAEAECEASVTCTLPWLRGQELNATECELSGYCSDVRPSASTDRHTRTHTQTDKYPNTDTDTHITKSSRSPQWDVQYLCYASPCCLIPPVQGPGGGGACVVGELLTLGCLASLAGPDCVMAGGACRLGVCLCILMWCGVYAESDRVVVSLYVSDRVRLCLCLVCVFRAARGVC